jgi:cullin-associated NEDD8-dissociated protein 1
MSRRPDFQVNHPVISTDSSSDFLSSGEVSSDLVRNIIQQLKQYLVTTDITVLSEALLTLSGLLRYYPKVSYPLVENQVLPAAYQLACSPLVTGPALESILQFFGTLVEADGQIANHVIPGLIKNMDELGSDASPSNISKCLAKTVSVQMGIAAGTIAEFTKYIKVDLSFFQNKNLTDAL